MTDPAGASAATFRAAANVPPEEIPQKMPSLLAGLALDAVAGEGHTAVYNGGSPWAFYWLPTLQELRPRLVESGYITEKSMSEFDQLYSDPHLWTSAMTFIASWGRKR